MCGYGCVASIKGFNGYLNTFYGIGIHVVWCSSEIMRVLTIGFSNAPLQPPAFVATVPAGCRLHKCINVNGWQSAEIANQRIIIIDEFSQTRFHGKLYQQPRRVSPFPIVRS